jgi:type I restriction enzyme S subunit
VVTIGSIGKKMTKAHCDCFINQAVNAVIPSAEFDEEFVYYVLKYNLAQLKTLDSGTASGRENVSKSSFSGIRLNVPKDKRIQQKIGAILSAYDDLIENNLQRIKLLEEFAQRTYEEWFVKFRVDGVDLEVDAGTGLPAGWDNVALNDLAEIVSGFSFKSSEYVDEGVYKIVTIKNVQDGYFVPHTTDSLVNVPAKVKKSQHLETADIILSLTGNVGRSCLVYGNNYLLNQRVAKIVPKEEHNRGFIYTYLRNKSTITNLENLSNGVAQQNLSPINMGKLLLTVAPSSIQERFGNLVNPMIASICNLNLQNRLLEESRDILLPRLMSGEVEV